MGCVAASTLSVSDVVLCDLWGLLLVSGSGWIQHVVIILPYSYHQSHVFT